MSGPDSSDRDKSFLARWSQRKREALRPDRSQDTPVAHGPRSSPQSATEADAPQEFDLSTLPKLEDLTETTDITAFLRKGVPQHLRNAALRKSWALDPAIRNYVNPALDYAYDWNTPGGVPGSSEIGAEMDVERVVSQIMGSGEPVAKPSNPAADGGNEPASGASQFPDHAAQLAGPDLPEKALRLSGEATSTAQGPLSNEGGSIESGDVEQSEARNSVASQVRRHGTAKPIV